MRLIAPPRPSDTGVRLTLPGKVVAWLMLAALEALLILSSVKDASRVGWWAAFMPLLLGTVIGFGGFLRRRRSRRQVND